MAEKEEMEMASIGAVRLTVAQQVSRNVAFRGKGLAIEVRGAMGMETRGVEVIKKLPAFLAMKDVEVRIYTPFGIELNAASLVGKTAKHIDKMAEEVDSISQAAAGRAPQVDIPEMIDIPGMSGKAIMRAEITVGFFKQVMEGYEITGHKADELQSLLADSQRAKDALVYVNLHDVRDFAKRLSDLTGRKFRVITEDEWLAARDKLSGENWTWTETPYDKQAFVLRRLANGNRVSSYPEFRYDNFAARLVEDK